MMRETSPKSIHEPSTTSKKVATCRGEKCINNVFAWQDVCAFSVRNEQYSGYRDEKRI